MGYITAMFLFAITTTVTPGPNNIIIATSGVNFGIFRSFPLLLGICIGFSTMVFLVSLGFGEILLRYSELYLAIKIVGVFYLVYLAWQIARSKHSTLDTSSAEPLSFWQGFFFQWVNAKAWIVATSAIAAFTTLDSLLLSSSITLSLVFLVTALPSVGVWLLFGTAIHRFLNKEIHLSLFNYLMATLLLCSVIPTLIELLNTQG
ncbi:lysine transporter LysE [Photobacterium lutimaris]|uniref:Lysine transporter LysE n=1 Tax=Photobacterium lutimaris TaxID=388278 RepID=A0A2T3IQH4_9GAMM|nr:lysine transporter LysE [Photobacterium lutimaris]